MAITKAEVGKLEAALAKEGVDEDADTINEVLPHRRKGLVPTLEPADAELFRLLATWRFANPVSLAAIVWPERTPAAREWRMRRFVDCGLLGRKRLRFPTTRHVVWARAPAARIHLDPPAPVPLAPPRWSEDVARHGWMRSNIALAYQTARWKKLLREQFPRVSAQFRVASDFNARVWASGDHYPFDCYWGRPLDSWILHITVVDDRQMAVDRILDLLPLEKAARSSRIHVRIFPCDDFTVWAPSTGTYRFEESRILRLREGLKAAGFVEPFMPPPVSAWKQEKS